MKLLDYDFDLPDELIAQHPSPEREVLEQLEDGEAALLGLHAGERVRELCGEVRDADDAREQVHAVPEAEQAARVRDLPDHGRGPLHLGRERE